MTGANTYCFEHPVTFIHTGTQSRGFIDLYRAGHFVMEAKQGTGAKAADDSAQPSLIPDLPEPTRKGHGSRGTRRWDDTMLRARNQADGYARAVSRTDGWPPFLLIVDVGHLIEVYADFSGQGQGYTQFPDGNRYRIMMDDLRDEKVRDRLRLIWTDPQALDPSKVAAQVTREVADRLAALGKSFEAQGHEPEDVARFLMRCLFTMFAEDVDLIPEKSFSDLLKRLRGHPEHAAPALKALWQTMNTGGFSPVLMADLKRFNGGLFKEAEALPLSEVQLSLLIEAASRDWREVEPAIFGTLLERALDKRQRHKLGAHYTPRAYVERLVVPTIIEPLRNDWRDVQAAAVTLSAQGREDDAREAVRAFHARLCEIRVHDQIDAAVAEAYGWPADLSDDEILHRLVDLNRQRAAEEARGHIRWLRPEYQNPAGRAAVAQGEQTTMEIGPADTATKAPWPKSLPEQIAAVRAALSDFGTATALLHKSGDGRASPFAGQTYPATSVTGVPSAVKRFRTATRTWNSAT